MPPKEDHAPSPWETVPGAEEGIGWDAEDEGCDIEGMKEYCECVKEVGGEVIG
jgi:hypothetical protein